MKKEIILYLEREQGYAKRKSIVKHMVIGESANAEEVEALIDNLVKEKILTQFGNYIHLNEKANA